MAEKLYDKSLEEQEKSKEVKSPAKAESGYLSDRTVEGQQEFLNDFITKINANIDKGIIEVRGIKEAGENEKAMTTDTHGDLMSVMGAAAMCGVKFKKDDFLYYDREEGIYYEKVGDEYYKYTPPYEGKKNRKEKLEGELKKENIILVPIPDTANARELYHLGDVLDRGQESLTSLLLCEICPNIKLAQGNHEFEHIINIKYGYKKELPSIELVLARMKHNGRINAGYYDGKGDNVISYSHTPLLEDHVLKFFNFLNSAYMTDKYSEDNPPVVEYLDKEFEKQKGHEGLAGKVKNFLKKKQNLIKEDNLNFETIKNDFTKEEMLIIKNVIAGALIERQFEVAEDGKITLYNNNNGFTGVYDDFNELISDKREGGTIINWDRTVGINEICPSVIGHSPTTNKIVAKGKCLNIDDEKSSGYRTYGSCATITNLNIKTGEVNNSSFIVKKKQKGEKISGKIKRTDNSITDNFRKNEVGYEAQKLDNFKLLENVIENKDIDITALSRREPEPKESTTNDLKQPENHSDNHENEGQENNQENEITEQSEKQTPAEELKIENDLEKTYENVKQEYFESKMKKDLENKDRQKIEEEIKAEIKETAELKDIESVLKKNVEQHKEKAILLNELIKKTNNITNGTANIVNMINEINGKPDIKQTAAVLKTISDINDPKTVLNNKEFREKVLNEINIEGKSYSGFGGSIIYDGDEISFNFDKGGFVLDQLERLGFDKNDEYKEIYDMFKDGKIVFSKQPNGKINDKEALEFMAAFKLNPIEAYLNLCNNKDISIKDNKGNVIDGEKNEKIKKLLAMVTETRHAVADVQHYSDTIEKENRNKIDNLDKYKALTNIIKEHSIKTLMTNSSQEFGTENIGFSNPTIVAKYLNKVLKIIDNKINNNSKDGEEEILNKIVGNFSIPIEESNKKNILTNCLLNIYSFNLEKTTSKIDEMLLSVNENKLNSL